MMITETERLRIAEADTKDSAFFYRLLNSPGWLTYIGNRNIHSEEDATVYIDNAIIKSYQDNGFGLYKISLKENKEAIGICGFVKRSFLSHPDLGFAILPQYEGKGYMYETTKSVLQYGFSMLHFETIYAVTIAENTKSQQLLRKLDFKLIDTIQPDTDKAPLLLFSLSSDK